VGEHLAVRVDRAADVPTAVQAQQHAVADGLGGLCPQHGYATELALQVVDAAGLGGDVAPV